VIAQSGAGFLCEMPHIHHLKHSTKFVKHLQLSAEKTIQINFDLFPIPSTIAVLDALHS